MEEFGGKIWYDCSLILYLWVLFDNLWNKMEFTVRWALYSIHSKEGVEIVWRVLQSRGGEYLDGTQGVTIHYFLQQYI